MKVIHLISGGDVGGAKTHVLSLLGGLKENHEVNLICFIEGEFAQDARKLGIPTKVLPGKNFRRVCQELADLVEKEQAELVHCHGSRANLVGFLLKRKVAIPVITTIHSDPRLDYLGRPFSNLTYGVANRLALRHMDGWVCVSKQLRDMQVAAGRDPGRTFVINNGVDFSHISASTSREQYWEDNGLSLEPDSVVFGIAARISPVKDMGTLIRAFSKAVAQNSKIRLAIAGDGEQRKELEQLAQEICPAGTVKFLGWVSDTDSFYNAIDVNMLTSLSEGLPYAIPEGARMRCATIATKVGAVPTIVIDGETGFLVNPGDVEAVADRMVLVAGDCALRERLGLAIFEKVRREFSAEATVRTQQEIYDKVIRRYHRSSEGRDGALICGAYGRGNIGDESVLESIIQQLLSEDEDLPICVMSKTPDKTAQVANVRSIYTFSRRKMRKEMKKAHLFISGGGSLIQDATSTRSLLFYLYSIYRAHKMGCKVMMYGCGIGPLYRERNRKLTVKVINRCVDLVALRDPDSARALQELGIDKPVVRITADPAFLQSISDSRQRTYEAYRKSIGIEENGKYCLFSLRPWGPAKQLVNEFAAAAEHVYEKHGMTPVFFQLEPAKDQEITEQVASLVRCPKIVLPTMEDSDMVCALIRDMKLVVSMRLHALIFASGQKVPVVGIVYDPKVNGYMDYLGQRDYIGLEEVTVEALCSCIDKAVDGTTAENEALDRMRKQANQNGVLAGKLLRGEPID